MMNTVNATFEILHFEWKGLLTHIESIRWGTAEICELFWKLCIEIIARIQ